MQKRNAELLLLILVAVPLGIGSWHAAQEHVTARNKLPEGRPAAREASGPVNVLECRPDQLLSILSREFDSPELERAHKAILEWRARLTPAARSNVVLADLGRITVDPGIRGDNRSAGRQPRRLIEEDHYRALRPFLFVRNPGEARRTWLIWTALLFGAVFAAHFLLRLTGVDGNQVLLPLAFLLTGTSAVLMFTLRDPLRDSLLYPGFVTGIAGGCAALVFAARFVRLRVLEEFKYLIGFAALALSALLMIFGAGPAGTDARINLLGFQPVEYIKLLVVLFLAAFLAGKDVELRRLNSARWLGLAIPRGRDILPIATFVCLALGLFFLQKDLGPALILYLVFLGVFVLASYRIALGAGGLLVLVSAFWAVYRFRILQTVATRIEMWMSPWDNHRPGGVQLAESLWALASGGFAGSGVGRGDPQYIPAGHTDLLLAAAGEAFGFAGLAALLLAHSLLFAAMLYSCRRSRSSHAFLLGFGLALILGVQAAVIATGSFGVLPLTGVPVPFMSFGKSAMIAHFLCLGLAINIASTGNRMPTTDSEVLPRRIPVAAAVLPSVLLLSLLVAVFQCWQVMVSQGDDILCRGALTPQQDGVRRFSYNRRILDLASRIPRGTIRDRSGFPLATSSPEEIRLAQAGFPELGLDPPRHVRLRFYPLGPAAVQLIGHTGSYWTDPRTVERGADTSLRGYPAGQTVVLVDGRRIVRRDYSSLVPAFRDRFAARDGKMRELLAIDKDVRLTMDARLQLAAVRALESNLPVIDGVPRTKAAAVVLEPSSGAILACASLPSYDPNTIASEFLDRIYGDEEKAAYDRARFEIYPPGSTFKVVLAAAALEAAKIPSDAASMTVVCRHENYVAWEYGGTPHSRRVTDDEAEFAHGRIGLERALVESCNVYFASLGAALGSKRLYDFAHDRFRLELKGISGPADLEPNLPDNSYGQAKITASPLRLAAVAASVINGGNAVEPLVMLKSPRARERPTRIFSAGTASRLSGWMVEAVRAGTGHRATVPGIVVGGKTGTAQNEAGDRQSHSWFIGFAYPESLGAGRAVAFAFLIENGGYGGRAAAQAAHDFIAACFQPEASGKRVQ